MPISAERASLSSLDGWDFASYIAFKAFSCAAETRFLEICWVVAVVKLLAEDVHEHDEDEDVRRRCSIAPGGR
jgi:hypothetical protein